MFRNGFRFRITTLVAIIVLPLYVLILIDIRSQYIDQQNEAYSEAGRLTRVIIEAQRSATRSVEPLLATIAGLREVRTMDGRSCSRIFSDLLENSPNYINIGAVTSDGDLVCSAVPARQPVNVSDLSWFKRTMESRTYSAGDFEIGKVTGKHSFSFGQPVYDYDGNLNGAVYISFDVQAMGDILRSAEVPAGTVLTEIDRNATIIARFPEVPGLVGSKVPDAPIVRNVLGGRLQEGVFDATGLDGVSRLYAFSQLDPKIESSPYVIVGFAKSEMYSQLQRVLFFNLFGLAAITLIVLLVAYEGVKIVIVKRMNDLEETERLRNEFMSLASHQLRTPVTAIRWLLELLLAGKPDPLTAKQTELVTEAKKSADVLANLVSEFIEAERGGRHLSIKANPTDIEAIVRAAIDELDDVRKRKNIRIEVKVEDGLPQALVDRSLVLQIAINLLGNSLKYSPENATVNVIIRTAGRKIRLEVSDNGIGIPAEENGRVFERFYRASNVRDLHAGGTGLGLYLSKLFAERMGGSIGFTSERDKGATFWVTFPRVENT